MRWLMSKSGRFEVKSFYEVLLGNKGRAYHGLVFGGGALPRKWFF